MEYKPWMDFITPDDIPNDDLRNVEAFAKYETALALMLYCPGMTISVPTLRFSKAKRINTRENQKKRINPLWVLIFKKSVLY